MNPQRPESSATNETLALLEQIIEILRAGKRVWLVWTDRGWIVM